MDFGKLRSAVLEFWRFSSPPPLTSTVIVLTILLITRDAWTRAIGFIRIYIQVPSPEVRQGLAFLGLDKLI